MVVVYLECWLCVYWLFLVDLVFEYKVVVLMV